MMLTTGDKLLNIVLKRELTILKLSDMSGVSARTLLDIMADNKEPELKDICKIAKALEVDVRKIYGSETNYDEKVGGEISVTGDIFFELAVLSSIQNMELDELAHKMLEKGINEYLQDNKENIVELERRVADIRSGKSTLKEHELIEVNELENQ